MKRIVLCSMIILFLSGTALQARLMSPPSMARKFLIEPHGAVGISMMGGELPEGNDQVMGVGFAYTGGVSFGYAPINAGAVMFGVEYTGKPFIIHGDHPVWGKYTDTINTNFVDILFGWKGYVSYFYYEVGLFLGPKVGKWEYARVYDDKDVDRVNGFTNDIDENNADHDFGVQMQAAFVPAYESSAADTSLTTVALLFKAGFTFLI